MKKIKLSEIYEDFIKPLKAQNYAPETITHYKRAYDLLSRYMNEIDIKYLTKFTQDDWIDFMHWLHNGKRNDVTVNTYLRGAKAFILFSQKNYHAPELQPYLLRLPETQKELYTMEQISALIKEPINHNFVETRGWTLSCLLMYCCLRVKTLCDLKVSDIDFETHEIRIRTLKNKKVEILPLTEKMEEIFRIYLIEREKIIREHNTKNEYVFITCQVRQMTRFSLYSTQADYNKKIRGVDKTGLHIFRNNFAKLMITNGSDAFTLQRWMTHRHIKSTKVYVDLFSRDLFFTAHKYNPLENLKNKI